MHYTIHTKKEKLAHLERAKTLIKQGTGSFHSYADAAGISRSTFYKWAHAYGYVEDEKKKNGQTMAFINLGKPLLKPTSGEQKLVVQYYGSRIEVSLPDSLLTLLKGIRIEGFI